MEMQFLERPVGGRERGADARGCLVRALKGNVGGSPRGASLLSWARAEQRWRDWKMRTSVGRNGFISGARVRREGNVTRKSVVQVHTDISTLCG